MDTAKEAVLTPCGHLFCWPCLYRWIQTRPLHKDCPTCKRKNIEKNCTPLYGSEEIPNRDETIPPRPKPRPEGSETAQSSGNSLGRANVRVGNVNVRNVVRDAFGNGANVRVGNVNVENIVRDAMANFEAAFENFEIGSGNTVFVNRRPVGSQQSSSTSNRNNLVSRNYSQQSSSTSNRIQSPMLGTDFPVNQKCYHLYEGDGISHGKKTDGSYAVFFDWRTVENLKRDVIRPLRFEPGELFKKHKSQEAAVMKIEELRRKFLEVIVIE